MANTLTISCEKANLPKIREFVSHALLNTVLSEVETHKVVLAVDEVCANLIIHANKCDPSHFLDMEIKVLPKKKVTFIIKDKGISFDFSQYQEPSMDEIVHTRRKGGLGLILVRRIMDDIEFTTEKNYNICRLVKNL